MQNTTCSWRNCRFQTRLGRSWLTMVQMQVFRNMETCSSGNTPVVQFSESFTRGFSQADRRYCMAYFLPFHFLMTTLKGVGLLVLKYVCSTLRRLEERLLLRLDRCAAVLIE